jgi:predicted RNA binding protein YcfA (HicA-like mRNA interferase family)
MGKRSTPPLTPSEVVAILSALGFSFKRKEGSHAQWEHSGDETHPRSVVTVDMHYRDFDEEMMRNMIRQSSRTKGEFYGATKRSARRASVPYGKTGEAPEPEPER